jgi:hypothetical protein
MTFYLSSSERMRIASNGAIKFYAYGSGTFTGTATQKLAVDSSGNLIEIPIGAGPVDGSGTANYITRWSDTDTITTSSIYETGGNIGINTTSPTGRLTIAPYATVNSSSIEFTGADNAVISSYYSQVIAVDNTNTQSGRQIVFAKGGKGYGTQTKTMMVIDADSGNVGIGTSSPSLESGGVGLDILNASYTQLRVRSSNSSAGIEFKPSSGERWEIQASNSNQWFVYNRSDDAYRLLIDGSGNVGIGTTSPSQKLEVVGTITAADTANSGRINLGTNDVNQIGLIRDNTYDLVLLQNAASGNPVYISGAGDVRVSIDSNDNNTDNKFVVGNNAIKSSNDLFYVNEAGTGYFSGSVGIGTTSPTQKLHVAGNIYATGYVQGGTAYISDQSDVSSFGSNSATRSIRVGRDGTANDIFITGSNGNVGIGTASPQGKLDVSSLALSGALSLVLKTTDSGTANGTIRWKNNANSDQAAIGSNYNVTDPGALEFLSGNTTNMILRSNGNVGIGTTSPSSKLEVYDSANANTVTITSDGANEQFRIRRYSNTNEQLLFGVHSSDYSYIQAVEQGVAYRALSLNPNGGNVGIGTTNPVTNLHINGVCGPGSSGALSLAAPAAGGGCPSYIIMGNNDSAGIAGPNIITAANRTLAFGVGDSFSSNSGGNFTGLMYILDSGNVGIGTTSPSYKLQVNADGAGLYVIGANSSPYTQTIASFVYGGNSNSINIENQGGKASFQARDNGNSAMNLHINPVGGNVGIGTTSPSQKLDVAGRALVDQFQYTKAINYSGGDLDSLILAGFYDGSGMANAPNSGWFYVTVEKHSDGSTQWVHQTATSFGAGNTPNEVYTRVRVGSTWGAWKQLGDAASISGTTNYVSKFTSANSIGNSLLYDNGTNVGIGTTSPTEKLHVRNGNLLLDSDPGTSPGIWMPDINGNPSLRIVTDQTDASYTSIINGWGSSANSGVTLGTTRGDGTAFQVRSEVTLSSGFATDSGTTRFIVLGNGNVGIGTTSPSQKLHVDGNLRVTGAYYDSNNSAGTSNQILSSTGTGTDWIDLSAIAGVDGSGSASLVAYWVDGNTITGSAGFFFNNSTNTLTVPSLIESSAERFKTNITPLTGSLEKVQQLQGVVFNRVDVNSNREIGFIADQVEKIYPELVSYDDDGKVHGLQYPRVTAVLVESIKELTQQIQDQNIFIQDLKSRIEYLENKLR